MTQHFANQLPISLSSHLTENLCNIQIFSSQLGLLIRPKRFECTFIYYCSAFHNEHSVTETVLASKADSIKYSGDTICANLRKRTHIFDSSLSYQIRKLREFSIKQTVIIRCSPMWIFLNYPAALQLCLRTYSKRLSFSLPKSVYPQPCFFCPF